MRVWSYVITYDGGSAPNFEPPAVTLVVCKPRIRKNAQVGDLVLGFNGKPLSRDPHSVRWAGVIGEVLAMENYWEDRRFSGKRPGRSQTPDNIYQLTGGIWNQIPNTTHDQSNVKTDLSGKNAVIFKEAWYFGDQAPHLPEAFGLRVTANRRNEPLSEIGIDEWTELRAWLTAHDGGLPKPAAQDATSFRSSKCR